MINQKVNIANVWLYVNNYFSFVDNFTFCKNLIANSKLAIY